MQQYFCGVDFPPSCRVTNCIIAVWPTRDVTQRAQHEPRQILTRGSIDPVDGRLKSVDTTASSSCSILLRTAVQQ